MKLFSILIILLATTVNVCSQQEVKFQVEDLSKPEKLFIKYRNYDFVIKIDVQERHPDYNCKYLINLKWEHDAKNNLIFYHDKLLQRVNFENKYDKRSYVVERLPKDTLQYLLTNTQLDSIYTLTAKMFQPDLENLSKDSVNHTPNYDGYWTDIEFRNINEVIYKITVSGISDNKTLYNYHNLLSYLKSLEINRVFFPAVDSHKLLLENEKKQKKSRKKNKNLKNLTTREFVL